MAKGNSPFKAAKQVGGKLNAEEIADKLKSLSDTFAKLGDVVKKTIGSIDSMVGQFVALSNPATYARFQMVARDFQAVFGQILAPVLTNATKLIRQLADALLNSSPEFKKMLQGMAQFAINAVILAGKISAASAVIAGELLTTLQPLLELLTKISEEGFGRMLKIVEQLKGPISEFIEEFAKALEDLYPIFRDLAENGLKATMVQLGALMSVVNGLLETIKPLITIIMIVIKLFNVAMSMFWGLVGVISKVLDVALMPLTVALKVLEVPITLLAKLFETIGSAFGVVFEEFGKLFSLFKEIGKAFEPLQQAFGELFEEIQGIFTDIGNAFREIVQTLASLLGDVLKGVISVAVRYIKMFVDAIVSVVETIKEVILQIRQVIQSLPKRFRDLFGIGDAGKLPGKTENRSSVGAAVAQVSSMSFAQVGQRARQLSAQSGSSPEVKAIEKMDKTVQDGIDEILRKMGSGIFEQQQAVETTQ